MFKFGKILFSRKGRIKTIKKWRETTDNCSESPLNIYYTDVKKRSKHRVDKEWYELPDERARNCKTWAGPGERTPHSRDDEDLRRAMTPDARDAHAGASNVFADGQIEYARPMVKRSQSDSTTGHATANGNTYGSDWTDTFKNNMETCEDSHEYYNLVELLKEIENSSEEEYDFDCGICKKQGETVDSVGFCTDCRMFLCIECAYQHINSTETCEHKLFESVHIDDNDDNPTGQGTDARAAVNVDSSAPHLQDTEFIAEEDECTHF